MDRGSAGRLVPLHEVPRRLRVEILVPQTGELDRLPQGVPEVAVLEVLPDLPPLLLDVPQHPFVPAVEEARLGHATVEVLGGERKGTVDEVPVHRQELGVVPLREVLPGELRVLQLRHRRDPVVPERVRVEAVQKVGKPDAAAAACAHPFPGDIEELRRGHVVRQRELGIVPHEDGGPEQRVEHDVVLPHEVAVARLRVVPPILPAFRVALPPPELAARGEVSHERLEPDVDPLPLPARQRDLDPPVDVAGDRPVLQPLVEPRPRKREDGGPPEVPRLHVGAEPILELAPQEERVLRLLRDGRRPVGAAFRLLQVERVEEVAAALALVPPGLLEAAVGARPLHVPVRQVPPVVRAVGQHHGLQVDVPLLVEGPEEVLGHLLVGGVLRGEVQVEGDAQVLDALRDDLVVPLGHLLGGRPLRLRLDGDGRPVHVGARDHQDPVPAEPVEAGEDVPWEEAPDDVADVDGPAGIGPGDSDEHLGHRGPALPWGSN